MPVDGEPMEGPEPPPVTTASPAHRAAAELLRRERRLLAFPALAAVGSAAVLLVAAEMGYRVVLGTLGVLLEAGAAGLVPARMDYGAPLVLGAVALLVGAAVALATVTAVLAWCNLGLVAATDALRRDGSVSLPAATAAATRRLPHALAVGAVVGGTLMLPWLAERSTRDRHRWRFARLSGGTYTAARFLVGPAAVHDGAGPAGAFRRSHAVLAERFGAPVIVRIGAVRRYGALGLAGSLTVALAASAVSLLAGTGPWAWVAHEPVAVLVAGPLWVGVVYGSAAGAVVKTLLYVALRDGRERLPLVDAPVEDAIRMIRSDD